MVKIKLDASSYSLCCVRHSDISSSKQYKLLHSFNADGFSVDSSKEGKRKLITGYIIPGHTRNPHRDLSLLVFVIQLGNNSWAVVLAVVNLLSVLDQLLCLGPEKGIEKKKDKLVLFVACGTYLLSLTFTAKNYHIVTILTSAERDHYKGVFSKSQQMGNSQLFKR